MQSPDVKDAKALDGHRLLVVFANGEEKVFDIKRYLKYPVFHPLTDEKEFKRFHLVDGTIEWDCGADLSPDTFYLESTPNQMNSDLAK